MAEQSLHSVLRDVFRTPKCRPATMRPNLRLGQTGPRDGHNTQVSERLAVCTIGRNTLSMISIDSEASPICRPSHHAVWEFISPLDSTTCRNVISESNPSPWYTTLGRQRRCKLASFRQIRRGASFQLAMPAFEPACRTDGKLASFRQIGQPGAGRSRRANGFVLCTVNPRSLNCLRVRLGSFGISANGFGRPPNGFVPSICSIHPWWYTDAKFGPCSLTPCVAQIPAQRSRP